MTDILCLGCFVAGFIVAWVLRTGYVTAQISWAQDQAERKVRYWQGEAVNARAVVDHLLRELEAPTDPPAEPADRSVAAANWHRPDMN